MVGCKTTETDSAMDIKYQDVEYNFDDFTPIDVEYE
jgi:hypothetical protein